MSRVKSSDIKSSTPLLVVGFAVVALLVIIFAMVSLQKTSKVAELNDQMYQHPFTVSNAVLEANSDIISMHRYMKDVVLAANQEELEIAISLVEQHEQEVYRNFTLIKERFLGDMEAVNSAFSAFVDWKVIRNEVIILQRNGQNLKAATITVGKGAQHVQLLTHRMNVLIDFARNKALEFKSNSQKTYKDSLFVLYLLLTFIILSSIVTAFFVITQIRKAEYAQKKSEENVQQSQTQLLNVITGSRLGYWDWNYKTGEHIVNDDWLLMLGLSQQDITNNVRDWDDLIHPSDKEATKKTIQSHIQSGKNYISEFRMKHTDGSWVWIQGSGAVVEYDEHTHEPLRLCGTHQDITARKLAEEKLQLSSRVFSDTHEGITITNADRLIIDVNPAFSDITGYSREEVIGQNPRILSSGKQSPEFYAAMWKKINEQGHWQGEVWNRNKSGEVYAELLTISSLKDDKDNVVNYVGVFSDITQTKKQQEKLNLMAHYDVLTGLPNRALFVDRFQQAIAHSKRSDHQLAICFLDLDNFKPINDGYGHDAGDQILINVANRIIGILREEDTVSRQGGDEFALLLGNIDSFSQCEQLLGRILDALSKEIIIDDYSHYISASIGVTLYPFDDSDLDTLLRHADQAMYEAKVAGKNQYRLFSVQQDQQAFAKHHRLDKIKQALTNNEFSLYYQPKVNMVSGEVFGVEALIRWHHPDKGLIPPLEFLPIIDGTTLELEVGQWVINEAVTQLDAWQQQGIHFEVSINISSNHLLSTNFFSQLHDAMTKYPEVDSACLQLEILESSALGDLDAIGDIIKMCQETLGVNFALDDFGTGYSSLTHLRNLPINTIKIDQTFIRDMLDDPDDTTIIDGVIGLSDSFHRKVIAEGVETTAHGEMLIIMGCEEAQGYGIAKPMPAGDMPNWLSSYSPNQAWLSCGRQDRSPKEEQAALFRLICEQWQRNFISNIQSQPDEVTSWPMMERKHCPCNAWINRARQEQLFDKSCLAKLSKALGKSHYMAQSTRLKYQEGDLDTARRDLAAVQASFEEVRHALELCE